MAAKRLLLQFLLTGVTLALAGVMDGSFFSYHPLMGGAFFFCAAQAIAMAAARPRSGTRQLLHNGLASAGFLCGVAALWVIWENKDRNGYPHLTSWHAYAGVAAVAMAALNAAFGAYLFYAPDAAKRSLGPMVTSLKQHRQFGRATWYTLVLALALGVHSGFGARVWGEAARWALTGAVVGVGVLV